MTTTVTQLRPIRALMRKVDIQCGDGYIHVIAHLKTTQPREQYRIEVLGYLFEPGGEISNTLHTQGWISSDPNEVVDLKFSTQTENDPVDGHLIIHFMFPKPTIETVLQ